MIRGIEIRVYPNKEQTEYISRLLGCCRYVYNHLLDFQENLFEKEKRGARFSEVTAFFNKEKAECPFLREVHSKVLQQARIDLQTAWGNYFRTIGNKTGTTWKKPKDNPLRWSLLHVSCLMKVFPPPLKFIFVL